jgi:hypothetical protein
MSTLTKTIRTVRVMSRDIVVKQYNGSHFWKQNDSMMELRNYHKAGPLHWFDLYVDGEETDHLISHDEANDLWTARTYDDGHKQTAKDVVIATAKLMRRRIEPTC